MYITVLCMCCKADYLADNSTGALPRYTLVSLSWIRLLTTGHLVKNVNVKNVLDIKSSKGLNYHPGTC